MAEPPGCLHVHPAVGRHHPPPARVRRAHVGRARPRHVRGAWRGGRELLPGRRLHLSCIAASSLIGMVSGQTVSCIALTGSMTIPTMIKGGFTREEAGAIEVMAANGSQLHSAHHGARCLPDGGHHAGCPTWRSRGRPSFPRSSTSPCWSSACSCWCTPRPRSRSCASGSTGGDSGGSCRPWCRPWDWSSCCSRCGTRRTSRRSGASRRCSC